MFVQQRVGGSQRLVTSASDLTAASACEFAFLRRVDARLGRNVLVPDEDDPMLKRAGKLGDAHEARVLADYVAEFGEAPAGGAGGVVAIARVSPPTAEALIEAQNHTLKALRGGAEVVFQATFFDPAQVAATGNEPEIGFVGFADFLQLSADESDGFDKLVYEVQDTKLARRAKVSALMQLATYAEQLVRIGVAVSPEIVLILGDGSRSRHKLSDIAPVLRSRRARLHKILLERARAMGANGQQGSAEPVAWRAPGIAACGRCEVCEVEVERTRDPLLIAGIRASQREKLIVAGLDTIDKVAEALHTESIEGLTQPIFDRLCQQAALQIAAVQGSPPEVRVVDPAALGAIPQPNVGDLFFDFEGDPMFQAPGRNGSVRWGLDYLFGMVDIHESFTTIWAHDLNAEREALERFLALVAERREKYPAMRIYHYASYERTHLLSIAARHGVGEAEVDQLLRKHVLVDLYPIVRHALRVGSRSYSIKKLEPLYMGAQTRDDDGVTNAAQSVTEYADATALMASSDSAECEDGQRRLDDIADYNRYDCVSTLRLRDWLLSLAAEHNVPPFPPVSADQDGGVFEVDTIATSLAWYASTADDEDDRRAAALAGSAIDYYQREQKSFWWAHYARLVEPIEDWADERDVMVIDTVSSQTAKSWFTPDRARVERRHVRLRGELAPGSTLKVGSDAYVLYEYPAPFSQTGEQPGARGARPVRIIEVHDDGVTIQENLGNDADRYDDLPVALVPGPPPRPGRQRDAIQEWGRQLVDYLSSGTLMPDPVYDIMRRRPPRLVGATELVNTDSAEALAAVDGDDDARTIGAVISSLRLLDRSALAVQGPPGTGKTYLAARAIRTLVERDGWHIGVVAQSHRVVENVLEGVVAAGLDPALVGKVPQGGKLEPGATEPAYTVILKDQHSRFLNRHKHAGRGAVIGGTAWDFSHEGRVGRHSLDLLVIDEAGQFSLAPTIAASVAAQRLLLLGDPQQLPQVSQGSHPEPVDSSALGWLLGDHETMPPGQGYFIAETRRMRPELTDVVSELAYEGRLAAHPSAAQRVVSGAGPAGLVWHPVEHAGNSTSSVEEAVEIVRISRETLQGTLSEPGQPSRRLTQADLIVVAAYNAQVENVVDTLAKAGLDEVRVGTVDKFQGQEAAIAIVTLAASSIEDIPRGVEFLLMRNRLNVAISRAQWSAHLVSSSRLGDGLPSSAEGVAALSGYLRLTERGSAGSRVTRRNPATVVNMETPRAPLAASKRSHVPAFQVMRITDQIARRRAEGHDVVSLCAGEPSARPAPGTLKPAGYTGPLGTSPLRETIAGHYRNWYGIDIDPRRVAVTTGSSGAFQLVFLAAFDPGDRVALASPGYPAYRNILTALGVQAVEIATGPETRYQPTPALLDAAVAEHGTLSGLVIASPANPTGTMLGRAELTTLVDWCRTHGTRVISDEIYHGITFPSPGQADPRGVTVAELDAEAVVINSFSKYWAMTGWRLGWAVLPESLISPIEALASNFALSPPAPAQELALSAFSAESYAERDLVVDGFARARSLILDAEQDLRWGRAAPSDGAFYYYSELGPQLDRYGSATEFAQKLLEQANVAVVPGVDFDPLFGDHAVRLSYAAGEAAVAEALERILRFQR